MNEEEYKLFLEYLYNEYIRERIHKVSRYYHPKILYEFDYAEWKKMRKAAHMIRYINSHCDNSDEIYNTFQLERIRHLINDVENGVWLNNRLAEEAGFFDALDNHFDEIVEGLKPEYLPEIDLEILKDFGSPDPRVELQGIIIEVRNIKTFKYKEKIKVSYKLEQTKEFLSEVSEEFKKPSEDEHANFKPPKKSRKWFKGLGHIITGSALTIADIAVAASIINFPVSPGTQTFGAVASVATGVGKVMTGVGEIRGE